MYIQDIEEACGKVLQGDQEALQQLGLDNYKYPKPKSTKHGNEYSAAAI